MVGLLVLGHFSLAEDRFLVADFDDVLPDVFSFKDEKGSVLNASSAYPDSQKGRVAGIKYDILEGGWGGYGIVMKGANVSRFRYIAMDLKGDKGGEFFEVGLRDVRGQERKKAITVYTDISTEWQRVLIPLADFGGVNFASLDNITFGFPAKKSGRLYFDNIDFEGLPDPVGAPVAPVPSVVGSFSNKAVVDGFERTAPESTYRTFSGDSSQLSLISSRVLYDGEYSMEMQYTLASNISFGSWVGALRSLTEPLNWSGVNGVKVWVKGDGSDNYFRFRFTVGDGGVWEYVDKKVLSSNRWTQVVMPISQLTLVGRPSTGASPDLSVVKSYELAVGSSGSASTGGSKNVAGKIWVDLLYVTGEMLRGGVPTPSPVTVPSGVASPAAPAVEGMSGRHVDFSLVGYTEYFFAPETQSQVNTNAKLITTGKLNNFSARVEFASVSQEFGQSSVLVGSSVTATENRYPSLEMPSFQVVATNIYPVVSLLTVGNQFIDYGVDVMAPVFGFKGLSVEGDYDRFNYHAVVLKHAQNSYTLGGRGIVYLPRWQIKGQGVYWEETGKTSASSIVNGQSQDSENLNLERLAQDLVYNVSALGRLFDDRLKLEGTYGYNSYARYADGDYTDPFNPVFSQERTPAYHTGGRLWRSKAQTNEWLLRGLEMAYGYRNIGTGYKPHYRQTPTYYDDTDSDQYGHNVRVAERINGWAASAEYDAIKRHSDSNAFQHKFRWGLGRYGYRGMDVTLNQEYKRAVYQFTSDRSAFTTDQNEKVISTEIYVRAQLSSRIGAWLKPKQDRVWHPVDNTSYTADSLQARLEFYITNNARFFAEHKISRYDNPLNEPQGDPYDDNYTRVSFEVTF